MAWLFTLHPCVHAPRLTYATEGSTLTVDGVPYDFGPLEDGSTLPRGERQEGEAWPPEWLMSDVTRTGATIHLGILVGIGPWASDEARFPAPVKVLSDRDVPLPDYGPLEDPQLAIASARAEGIAETEETRAREQLERELAAKVAALAREAVANLAPEEGAIILEEPQP
jgi:hypothetical protein